MLSRDDVSAIADRLNETYHQMLSRIETLEGDNHELGRRWEEEKVERNRVAIALEVAENEAERLRGLLEKAGGNVANYEQAKRTIKQYEERLEQVQQDKERLISQINELKDRMTLAESIVALNDRWMIEITSWRTWGQQLEKQLADLRALKT